MGRSPGIGVIAPGIGPGLDGDEAVAPVPIGHGAPGPKKVRIKRCVMLIGLVDIAPGCVALPQFDQRVAHRPPAFIKHAPGHGDTFTQRCAIARRVAREVVIQRTDVLVPVDRLRRLAQGLHDRSQWAQRCTQRGGGVRRVQAGRVTGPVARGNAGGLTHGAGGWRSIFGRLDSAMRADLQSMHRGKP